LVKLDEELPIGVEQITADRDERPRRLFAGELFAIGRFHRFGHDVQTR
jgi:hypothetical protein